MARLEECSRREWSLRESSDIDEARRVAFGRKRINRSASARMFLCVTDSQNHGKTFPAGMEPMGIERHRRSPQGERAGESESIEAQAKACTLSVKDSQDYSNRSRRESNPHLRRTRQAGENIHGKRSFATVHDLRTLAEGFRSSLLRNRCHGRRSRP